MEMIYYLIQINISSLMTYHTLFFMLLGSSELILCSPASSLNSYPSMNSSEKSDIDEHVSSPAAEDDDLSYLDDSWLQIECSMSADGVFITPGTACIAYYTCNNGTMKIHTCPDGQTFDRIEKSCSNSQNKMCHELICAGRVNGLYTDTTYDCQRYFTCEGGELTSIAHCPNDQRFNGTGCQDLSSVVCGSPNEMAVDILQVAELALELEDQCAGYDDGVYPGLDIDCRQYFICKSEKTLIQLDCPIGQRFNGQRCLPSEAVVCNSYCTDKEDGYHVIPKKNCKEYVRCNDEQTVEIKSCPPGKFFDEYDEQCESKSTTKCQGEKEKSHDRCKNKRDGLHTNYMLGCRDYFECLNGSTINYQSCENGKWDGEKCVDSGEFICSSPEPSLACLILGEGIYPDTGGSNDCKTYIYCSPDGTQVSLSCPRGKAFNEVACVPEESYKCTLKKNRCSSQSDGYFVDPTSGCRAYYYCSNKKDISYVCPQDQVFNGEECVEANTYKCTSNISSECEARANGHFADVSSDCKQYFYCLHGLKLDTKSCPDGERFNGSKCTDDEFTCHDRTKMPCLLLRDGYYILPDSKCQTYFKCYRRKITEINSCENGYSFDGESCANKSASCHETMLKQNENLISCKKHINGFFPDFQSGCRSYFYCINGEKKSLECPADQVFNGEVCIDKAYFVCPFFYMENQKKQSSQTE